MKYINLGIVTDYTLLSSLIKIDDLIDYAIKNKIVISGSLFPTVSMTFKKLSNLFDFFTSLVFIIILLL